MNKKLLLIALPALMVLAGCNNQAKAEVKPEPNLEENYFLEDTEAHEEIFGGEQLKKDNPFKVDPVTHPDADPSIGIQTKIDDKETVDTSDDTISIRFVAAVAFGEGQLGPTNAVWRRTVSSPDGTSFPKDTANIACTKAYTSMSVGDGEYSIDDFNADQEPDGSYTHFVAYTLRNIPLATYANYYVSAYLILSGEGGLNQSSKAVVTTVDPSIYKAAYQPTLGNFFITGTFNGTPGRITATSTRSSVEDANKASFEGLSIYKNDVFTIYEVYDTKLYSHGSSCLTGSKNPVGYYFSDNSGDIKANYKGNYNLFLNKSNEIWTAASNVVRPFYVHVDSWWFEASCTVALRAYDSSDSTKGVWFTWDAHSTYLETSAAVDPTMYDTLILVRVGEGKTPSVDGAEYGNKSKTLSFPNAPEYDDEKEKVKDCLYIYGASDPRDLSFGTRD